MSDSVELTVHDIVYAPSHFQVELVERTPDTIRRVGCLAHKLRRDARNLSCHRWFAVCCNTKKLVAPAILQSGEHFDDLLADIVCQVALKKW